MVFKAQQLTVKELDFIAAYIAYRDKAGVSIVNE